MSTNLLQSTTNSGFWHQPRHAPSEAKFKSRVIVCGLDGRILFGAASWEARRMVANGEAVPEHNGKKKPIARIDVPWTNIASGAKEVRPSTNSTRLHTFLQATGFGLKTHLTRELWACGFRGQVRIKGA